MGFFLRCFLDVLFGFGENSWKKIYMHKFPTKFSGLEEYFVGLRKWVFSCFCHFGFWQSKKGFLSPVCLLRKGFLFPVSFHFTNVKIYMHNFPANFSDSVENFSASFFFFFGHFIFRPPFGFYLEFGGVFPFSVWSLWKCRKRKPILGVGDLRGFVWCKDSSFIVDSIRSPFCKFFGGSENAGER